ncbi:hypothetical protein ACS0TY_031199 [Phlomoides rotata]
MELDLQNPLDVLYDAVPSLFVVESDHMPSLPSFDSSDLRFSIRRTALSLVSHVKFSYNLDPFLVYLSVNYVDRFLSKQEILDKRPWIAHVLVIASLSVAAKMRNADLSVSLSVLQREEGFEFDAQSVHRMETILLSTLQWRMRSITPFSFLQYFLTLLEIEDSSLSQSLKHRASNIIFNVQHDLKILKFKPSIIAASSLLCAIQDLNALSFFYSETVISSCEYVDRDALLECVGAMQEITKERYDEPSGIHAVAGGTSTPISVLDRQGTSSRSEDHGFPERDDVKRPRLNGLCDSRTFQISQIQRC